MPKEDKTSKPKAAKKDSEKPGLTAKERYAQRKKEGLCVDCGKRKAKADHVQCQVCISATEARAAKRLKAAKG